MAKIHHEERYPYRPDYGMRRGERVRVVSVYAHNVEEARAEVKRRFPDEEVLRWSRHPASVIDGRTNYLFGITDRGR